MRWSPCDKAGEMPGIYDLHLYCHQDNPLHGFHEFPHEYLGKDHADCVRQARRRGWIIPREWPKYALRCPKCSGKTPPPPPAGESDE